MSGLNYPYPFVSQLHPNESGENDCWEASLGAYLLAAGKLAAGIADLEVLNAVSLASRGSPDQPGNPDTTLSQADQGLAHYGLPVNLSYDWMAALNAPWAILLVDGVAITKADGSKPYPASWFSGASGPDHFVLWGPPFADSYNWLMNPLDPAAAWAEYDLESVRAAFGCAYLLPALSAPPMPLRPRWAAVRAFGLLSRPEHGSTALAVVPNGGTGIDWGGRRTDAAGTVWARLQWRNVRGWAPTSYVQPST